MPRSSPSTVADDVGLDLLLEREQLLRAPVEAPPGLGGLDAPAGAVEELRPEPLLERAHLQRHRRLCDAQPLGRLREAPPVDDRAEGGELARIHKRELIREERCRVTSCASGSTSRTRRRCSFFRPLIELLEERGHDGGRDDARLRADRSSCSSCTAYAHEVVGPPHAGGSRLEQGAHHGRAAARAPAVGTAPVELDLALSHASHELPLVARSLGIPSSYAFDYEFARVQHTLGMPRRASGRRPRRDPAGPARPARRPRAQGPSLPRPQGGVLPRRLRAGRVGARPARARPRTRARRRAHASGRRRSTTGTGTSSSRDLLHRIGSDPAVQAVVLPRTEDQRDAIASLGAPVPRRARRRRRRPEPRRALRPRRLRRAAR